MVTTIRFFLPPLKAVNCYKPSDQEHFHAKCFSGQTRAHSHSGKPKSFLFFDLGQNPEKDSFC